MEHGSFTPLIFSVSGGLAKEATTFYKRLATSLAEKWSQPYSITMNWLRCRISFSLLRSSIRCLRGARSTIGKPVGPICHAVDLVRATHSLPFCCCYEFFIQHYFLIFYYFNLPIYHCIFILLLLMHHVFFKYRDTQLNVWSISSWVCPTIKKPSSTYIGYKIIRMI